VTQDLFDDLRVFNEADDWQPAAGFGAGERIGSPDLADQAGQGAFAVAAEVVRFCLSCRERSRSDAGGALLFEAALSPGIVAIVATIPLALQIT